MHYYNQVLEIVQAARKELQIKLAQAAQFNGGGGNTPRITRIGFFLNNIFEPRAALLGTIEMQDVFATAAALTNDAAVVYNDDSDWNP